MNVTLAPTDFLRSSNTQRGFAMLFAIGFTLLMLAQFTLQLKHNSSNNEKSQAMVLTWIRPLLTRPEAIKPSKDQTSAIGVRKPNNIQVHQPNPNGDTNAIKPEAITAATNTEASVSFDSVVDNINANSARNNLNADKKFESRAALKAYEESKSDIQKMAEASNKPLSTPKLSKHERFQEAANSAVKPDCLRQGGSILSLFVVAYQAATDHCK